MRNFVYTRAGSEEEATRALSGQGVRAIAGGTDLLPLLKDEIASADTLLDLTGLTALRGTKRRDGALYIGALTNLSALATDPLLAGSFKALADACRLAATPQLRNMGTIGGNLLQQTRCWYYRGPFDCWLKGGEKCYARTGENELHSIFATEESPCVSAHPSDPAAALLALEASVTIRTAQGESTIPVEHLYALPVPTRRSFDMLPQGALITGITLPAPDLGAKSIYRKAMPRATWAFALAGIAIGISTKDGVISRARIGLSGVAPVPMRSRETEEELMGKKLEDVVPENVAEKLAASAAPLAHNGYKVALLKGLFIETWAGLEETEG
ncbi:MAG: FAD binding domain-containing protein [Chloroflexota bacterium]|nr:FAD binding domain-containing protein [Chloroflexota bacterium]